MRRFRTARVLGSLAVLALVAASCGDRGVRSAAEVRSCVSERLPAGAVDRVFVSTEQGVTTLNYFHNGSETDVSIFESAADAVAAEKAEARLGDAHDRRIENVLYSGGGVIEAAVVECAK